jgi:hypothetical protein
MLAILSSETSILRRATRRNIPSYFELNRILKFQQSLNSLLFILYYNKNILQRCEQFVWHALINYLSVQLRGTTKESLSAKRLQVTRNKWSDVPTAPYCVWRLPGVQIVKEYWRGHRNRGNVAKIIWRPENGLLHPFNFAIDHASPMSRRVTERAVKVALALSN